MRWILVVLGLAGPALADQSFPSGIAACWNIGSLSTEALGVLVTVEFEIDANGKPKGETITMVGTTGKKEAAQRVFDSAKRAIIRCGAKGYQRSGHVRLEFSPLDGVKEVSGGFELIET